MSFVSASNILKLHEYPSCAVINTHQPKSQGDGSIRSISLAKDGGWLILVPHLGPAEILRPTDQPVILHTIHGIPECTSASFYNTTKKNLALGTKEGEILIYNIKTRSVKKRFPKLSSSVTRVEFTCDDHYLVAGCLNGETFVYNASSNILRSTLKVPRSTGITTFRTSLLKKNHISVGSMEGVVAVWDLNTNKYKFSIGAHQSPITALATSPIRADILVSSAFDRQFCFYDITEGKCIANMFVENSVASIDFVPDGQSVAMGTQNGKIYFYDMRKLQQPTKILDAHSGPVKHLAFCKNIDLNGSNISLPAEEVSQSTSLSPRLDTSISVCSLLSPGPNQTSQSVSATSVNADSFMQDMLAMNNTAYSETSLPHPSRKSHPLFTPVQNQRLSQAKKILEQEPAMTSTPNPPLGGSQKVCPLTPLEPPTISYRLNEDPTAEIKKIVREEMSAVVEDMKNFISEKVNEVTQLQLKHGMMNVKDNIKIENSFGKLFERLYNQSDMEALMEENAVLKQRITFLEEVIQNNQNNF